MPMATVASPLTLEDFERLPDDGQLHEVDEGELVSMTRPKYRHSAVAKRFYDRLLDLEKHGGEVHRELPFALSLDPLTIRVPDVCFVSRERLAATSPDGYVEGAPELAVEVVSPSESAEDLERKVTQYLGAGGRLVWVVYSETRHVHVFRADGSVSRLSAEQSIQAPELFGEWSSPLAPLFEIALA